MKGRFLDAVIAAGRDDRAIGLATALAGGDQMLFDRDHAEGDLALDASALAAAREALRGDRSIALDTNAGRVFVQSFSPPRRCFVIGAVHIAQPLVPMLVAADYRAIVIDPRQSFATAARFPGIELSTEWPDEAMARLKPDYRSAVVTLTHDPKIDDPALIAALAADCFYIGALGSRRTHTGRLKRLAEQGVDERALARIHAPIGLPIGAFSQAEIAVAILAEMTQVLRRGAASTTASGAEAA